jgi:peptidoglycan/LPS O-acetylase OafA/YrhL
MSGLSANLPGELAAAPAAPATNRIVELDGLRGVACLLVVVGHYFGEVAHGFRFLTLEWIGVDVFFCLSGFLIGGILLDNRASPSYFATFYIRRGFRIFPIYFLTVSLVLLAVPRFAVLAGPAFPPEIYFGYVQNFVMAATGVDTTKWLMPTWTLCVEEQFYLLLPVILYLTPPRYVARLLFVLIASASLFRTALVWSAANKFALTMLLPTRWDLLFLGVLAAYARRRPELWARLSGNDRSLLKAVVFAGLSVLPVLIAADYWLGWRSFDMVGTLALGASVAGFLLLIASGAPEGARFRSRALCRLGRISYGLYLIHQPVSGLMHGMILGGEPDIATFRQVAVTLAALAVSVALAALSWRFFESPLVGLGHRWGYREAR